MARIHTSARLHRARLVSAATTVAILATALSGCGDGSDSGGDSGSDDGLLIGASFFSQDQKRYPVEAAIIKETAEKNGDEVIVNYAESNSGTQASQVDSMIQRGIDVLIIQSFDSKSAGAIVSKAKTAGVKVVAYDVPIDDAKPDYYVLHDNTELAKTHIESAAAAAPSGEWAFIQGDAANINAQQADAVYDELMPNYPDVEVVYDVNTPEWSAAEAQTEAEAALQKNPDIVAFIAMWDEAGQSVVAALKAAGKQPGDVFVTGTDASTPSLQLIAEGWQGETTWTAIDEMAAISADIAHALGTGEEPPAPDATVDGVPQSLAATTAVTKDNLCEFINDIAPDGWVTTDEVFGAGNNPC